MSENTAKSFDPARYLTLVSGKEYLEVRWRILWFRTEHPDGIIATELVEHDHERREATFKATVSIPDGGMATGHKTEDARGFGDYREKAETGAIGRALAALGYGTQFAGDHEYGADSGRVVDSPTPLRQNAPQRRNDAPQAGPGGATDKQFGAIRAMAKKAGIADIDGLVQSVTGTDWDNLTRQGASAVIEHLQGQAAS